MASIDELKALEQELDRLAESLPLLRLPVRVFLTSYFGVIDSCMHGPRLKAGGERHPEEGMALAGRLSYLTPLISRFPVDLGQPTTEDAMALMSEDPELIAQSWFLMSYGHLCELMPEVHRGRWSVDRRGTGFVLDHPDAGFRVGEERDVVLSELALQFVHPPPPSHGDVFDDFVGRERLDERFVGLVLSYAQHYLGAAFEQSTLSEEAFVHTIGVTEAEFHRFRAVWFALAEVCLGMADASERRALRDGPENPKLIAEMYEWIGPRLTRGFVDATVQKLGKLSAASYDALMTVYSFDPAHGPPRVAGDGFFPPVLCSGNTYLFSPHVLRAMMAARNILYATNKVDRKKFDDVVSKTLEPALIDDAAEVLAALKGTILRRNVAWRGGEMDLLAYEPATNSVLHVQAKAAIPSEGARMVQALEAHTRVGLDQLRAFRKLDQAKIDEIVGRAVERDVRDVKVVDVLLSRCCIGTNRVWKEIGDVAVVNVPLLREVVGRMLAAGEGLDRFAERAKATLEEIVRDTVVEWSEGTIDLGDATLRAPFLKTDQRKLDMYRARLLPPAGVRPSAPTE